MDKLSKADIKPLKVKNYSTGFPSTIDLKKKKSSLSPNKLDFSDFINRKKDKED